LAPKSADTGISSVFQKSLKQAKTIGSGAAARICDLNLGRDIEHKSGGFLWGRNQNSRGAPALHALVMKHEFNLILSETDSLFIGNVAP
jgi:hypothetical protein